MKTYQSKKNPEVIAKLLSEDDKCKTAMLEYIEGPDAGKTVTVTMPTLKRWWKCVGADAEVEEEAEQPAVNIDYEQVNTPYPEPKEKKYIPKPQSVVEYEAKQRKRYNSDLPGFDKVVAELGAVATKVNEQSLYIKFADKSTLWRKSCYIDIYAAEELWTKLTEAGLTSTANKDKDRPFHFRIETVDDYNKVVEVLNA